MNFRCFEQLNLEFSAQGAIFTGDNAQGKTSILEAICLLIRLHSPRTRRLRELSRFGGNGFGIAGQAWGRSNQLRFQNGNGLSLKLDGEEIERQRDYFQGGGLLVWMANDDLELVRGRSAARRRYLDFIGTQLWPDYRNALAHYSHALKCRNRLLKAYPIDARSMTAYEQIMAEHGAQLIDYRQQLVAQLSPLTQIAQSDLGGCHEELSIDYQHHSSEDLLALLNSQRESDRQRGSTQRGPHRDDIKLSLNQKPAEAFASEGQQRTLSIALKLAQGRLIEQHTGNIPVYLIDDVFGELDTSRRRALIAHLPEDSQIFLTTTNLDWMDADGSSLSMPHFLVEQGSVTPKT